MNSHYKIDRKTAEMIRDAAKGATLWRVAEQTRSGEEVSRDLHTDTLWNRFSSILVSFEVEHGMVALYLDPDAFTNEQRDFLELLNVPVVNLDESGVEVSR